MAGPLDEQTLRKVFDAAIATGLVSSRGALLAGIHRSFVASLPTAPTPAQQLMVDLNSLNDAGTLLDGSVPLRTWLSAAEMLAGPRTEAAVFTSALARL